MYRLPDTAFVDGEVYHFVGPYMVPAAPRKMVCDIQAEVARYFRIPVSEMRSQRRYREVARPRQIAMYLSRELTPMSLPQIGQRFGGRDHSTVCHAIKQIERLCRVDPYIAADVETLAERLGA